MRVNAKQSGGGPPSGRSPVEAERPLRSGWSDWLGVLARGLAMGVVEAVPGVSGGTIAFVTGIYRELLAGLASFAPSTILWCVADPKRFWRHHNLSFLACLGLGMAAGLLVFANLMGYWLGTAPNLVWAFFFGLILWAVFDIGRARTWPGLASWGLVGALCGFLVGLIEPLGAAPGPAAYFLGGALAIGAWLLPAVSGSFVLLVLGLYEKLLEAIAGMDLAVLAIFCLGCVAGVALFPRLFGLWLRRHFEPTMSFLTGFMAGSLARLWPWRFEGAVLTPGDWSLATGAPADVVPALAMMLAGFVTLWLLMRLKA